MCYQSVSSGIHARSFDLRLLLFLTVHSGALWGCQTSLHNWVAIKVVFVCIMKHGMGCVLVFLNLHRIIRKRMEIPL
jgi:hypothetical protein